MKRIINSRRFVWLVCGLISLIHVGYIFSLHLSAPPGTVNVGVVTAGIDTSVYIQSGIDSANAHPLYNLNSWVNVWPLPFIYSPLFAWFFSILDHLGAQTVGILMFILETCGYILALIVWPRALDKLGAHTMADAMRCWRPILLTFSIFFIQIFKLNIVGMLFFATGVVTWFLATKRDWAAAGVLVLILLCKPQWVFPASLPLFASQWQRTAKLALRIMVILIGLNVFYLFLVGPTYGLQQLGDYVKVLGAANHLFPWAGQGDTPAVEDFSLQQVLFFELGIHDWVWTLGGLLRITLVFTTLFHFRLLWQKKASPEALVWGMFSVYLIGMLILGQLHELTLGVCIFVCLRVSPDPLARRLSWLFLLYSYTEVIEFIIEFFGIPIQSYLLALPTAALVLWWACLRSISAEFKPYVTIPDPTATELAAAK